MCVPPGYNFDKYKSVIEPRRRNMSEADIAISEAAREYEEDGIVSTTTYMAMTQEGVDADSIIEFFEENQ